MGTSRHRKDHKKKLEKYKTNKKVEQDAFKKKMIDNYMKLQQEALANREEHTSTEEVVGPDINIDDLNMIDEWEPISLESDVVVDVESEIVNVDLVELDKELNELSEPLDKPIEL